MYQTLEQILQEANDRRYSADINTAHNHCSWWIFTRNPENHWHGYEKTIKENKEALYHQLVRLPLKGNYPWYDR